jgi:hypothetical protein
MYLIYLESADFENDSQRLLSLIYQPKQQLIH